ncbi:hypothetical protein EKK58_01865 [Candidatus Dependentiae bacterium]|nr:MAG: hypothetical protein EKK58_01865 [Candidatus Dependentiae bacterium]
MKKLILSCTFACFCLFGKKGIVDVYNNIPTKPQSNILAQQASIPTNVTAPAIASIESASQTIPITNLVAVVDNTIAQPETLLDENISLNPTHLVDVATVADVLPKLNLFNAVPLNDVLSSSNTLPITDITSIPNILEESPVLVITNEVPVDSSIVESLICEALQSSHLPNKVHCYKIVSLTDNSTQYVFAPAYTCKNPLQNIYEAIYQLVSSLALKLQELFVSSTAQTPLEAINENCQNITE